MKQIPKKGNEELQKLTENKTFYAVRVLVLLLLTSGTFLILGSPPTVRAQPFSESLFVSSFAAGTITKIDLTTFAQTVVETGLGHPESGLCTATGKVYFSDGLGGKIWRFNQDGSNLQAIFDNTLPGMPNLHPEGLSMNVNGDLFFNTRDGINGAVWELPGALPGTPLQATAVFQSFGEGTQFLPDASLLASAAAGFILRFVPPFTASNTGQPPVWASVGFSPEGIVLHGGLVYVSQVATNSILRFKPDGTFLDTFFSGPPLNFPFYFDFDSAGNLYVANLLSFDGSVAGGYVVRITPDGTASIIGNVDRPVGVTVCRTPLPAAKTFTQIAPLPSGSFVPLNTRTTWVADYVVANPFTIPIASVVLKDHFAASLSVDTSTITFSAPTGSGASTPIFTTSSGSSAQWSFTWSIGTLQPGQTATLSVQVMTDKNPSGAQEFTSPGLQVLNTGATLKWTPVGQAMQSSATLPVVVMAGNTVGAIDGVVSSQGVPTQSVTVSLFSGTSLISTFTTSGAGFYHFNVVAPGTYTVSATTTTGTATATVKVSAAVITSQNLAT